MELNLQALSVEDIGAFLNKIKHISSGVGVDFVFQDHKVSFIFGFKEQVYRLINGPYLKTVPADQWFGNLVTTANPGFRSYTDLQQLTGEIYTVMYVIAMPEII